MTYRVLVPSAAAGDIADAASYIARDAPVAAQRWIDGIYRVIESLSVMPEAHPRARECPDGAAPWRQVVFKSYRIIFAIAEDKVIILHVRHVARRNLPPPA